MIPIFYTALVCRLSRLPVSVSVHQILSCILVAVTDILLAMFRLVLQTCDHTILLAISLFLLFVRFIRMLSSAVPQGYKALKIGADISQILTIKATVAVGRTFVSVDYQKLKIIFLYHLRVTRSGYLML
jgi:hypothetical protein